MVESCMNKSTTSSAPTCTTVSLETAGATIAATSVNQTQNSNNTTNVTACSNSSSTVSSLRALRKQPTNASKKPTASSNVQQAPTASVVPPPAAIGAAGVDGGTGGGTVDSEAVPPIASLINTNPLTLPLVALPTKPLPVQMTAVTTSDLVQTCPNMSNLEMSKPPLTANSTITCHAAAPQNLGQISTTVTDHLMHSIPQNSHQTNTKSIQITALIQSNPMPPGVIGGSHNLMGHNNVTTMQSITNPADFQLLQASTPDPNGVLTSGSPANVLNVGNIPLVNNMLNCMQQSINGNNINIGANPGAGPGFESRVGSHHQALHHHHHHHHHHQCSQKSRENSTGSCSNLLKVDESADKTPKIGNEYQALVPPNCSTIEAPPGGNPTKFEEGMDTIMQDISNDLPALWHPATAECLSEVELSQYLLVASSCVVGGGSHNEEVALEILQKHEGNVQNALQELLSSYDLSSNTLNEDALSLFNSSQEGSDSEDDLSCNTLIAAPPGGDLSNLNINLNVNISKRTQQPQQEPPWQPFEVDLFYEGLVRYHKDFNKVSKHVGTKSVKDCVEFYYLWKNICFEESQSFKSLFAQTSSATAASAAAAATAATSTTAAGTPTTPTASTATSATSDSTASGASSTSSSMTDMTLNHHHHHHHHHHEGMKNSMIWR